MLRIITLLLSVMPLSAQTLLRFEWKADDVYKFRVQHETTVAETLPGKPTNVTSTKLTLARTWTVTSVSTDGSAMMSLTITAMRQEIARTGEETLVIDSSTREGAQAMSDYLNKPILTAKVDPRGRVSDVRAVVNDAAARLQAELPFRIELPETAIADVAKWERPFTIRLDPPVGTGEIHEAIQTYSIEKREAARTLVKVSTSLKTPPKEVAELQPLLPWLWEGTITLEPAAKKYLGAKLKVSREYPNHQGVGSKFAFSSTFEESRE